MPTRGVLLVLSGKCEANALKLVEQARGRMETLVWWQRGEITIEIRAGGVNGTKLGNWAQKPFFVKLRGVVH